MLKHTLVALTASLLLPARAISADYPPPPGSTRALKVPTVVDRPVIDGELSDDAWRSAAIATDFWISEQQRPPTEQTEVLVMSDDEYLYIGFRCYDSQPDRIQAIKTRRDAGLGNDDRVEVELDTFRNYRIVSTYSVNPNGVQDDAIAGGRASKIEWKGDWQAAAARTGYGWSAEIAIPYKILNYREDTSRFGVNFLRYQNRTDELSRWADVTPQGKREEMGYLEGLQLPVDVKENPLTFMPYVLAGLNVPDIKGKERNKLVSAGTTIRYEPRSNLTGVVSIYPDFSQLETQVTDIDFSYTEKFVPDPRPFFQEGSFYLGGDTEYFYSNRVPDFYVGGKMFAKPGTLQLGAFATYAPDNRVDSAMRLVKEFSPSHSAGLMLIGTSRQTLDNQLLVTQMEGREPSGLFYDADLAYSNTKHQPFDQGGAASGTLGWRSNYWETSLSGDYYDRDYFPANGLFQTDRYGTKSLNLTTAYYRQPAEGAFRTISGNLALTGRNTLDGRTQNHNLWIDGGFELRQAQISLNLSYSDGRYRPSTGRAEFADTLNHDHYWAANLDFNTRSSHFGYGLYYADGFLGGGDYNYVTGYAWVNPTDNTFINLYRERLESFGTSRQTTVNVGWNITPEDGLVARYIRDDEGDYQRLAYRHTVRAGVDIYAVYNKDPYTEHQFSVKVVWVVQ